MSAPPPEHDSKPRWSVSVHAEWQGGFPAFWRRRKPTGCEGEVIPRGKAEWSADSDAPRFKRALRSYAILLLVAFMLLIGGNVLLDSFPTHLQVASDGKAIAITAGGTTRAVTLALPIESVRFVPADPYLREFEVDGSDSINNGTYNAEYFATFANSPYYRFQAWLRDEGSYSNWRDLIIRDAGEHPFFREARPTEDERIGVPKEFEIGVDLRRIEIPRTIEFRDVSGGTVRVEIDRNDKYVMVVNAPLGTPETVPAKWYFSREWLPELAVFLYLLMRVCAFAILLVLLIAPIALLLPSRLPQLRRRPTRLVGLGLAALVAFAASTYVTVAIFDKMPHIYDAQSYYFQAKLFAEGVFYVPTPPDRLAFDVPFTVWEAGKWFTMYTPGASLVLAIGMKLGAPWLVGPILAMGGVLLTYAAASRQFGGRTALLAAVLMASSPFLHLQAGSFMSHVPGMFWGALVLYAAVRYVERRAIGWAMLGATALGCLFLTRELSAIVYGLTLGSFVLFRTGMAVWRSRSDRWRFAGDAAAAAVCLAIFGGFYLYYNWAVTGSPTTLPRILFDVRDNKYGFGEDVGFYGRHTLGGGLVNADEMLTSLGIMLFGWPFYLALALIVLPFVLRRAQTWDWVHGAIAAGFIIAYIGLYYHGITYGPRYYLDALPALVLLTARGFVALAGAAAALCRDVGRQRAQPRAELAALLLCLALLACNAVYFWPQQARLHGWLSNQPGKSNLVLGDFIERRFSGRVANVPNAFIVMRDRGLMDILGPLNCPRLDCATIFAYSADASTDAELRAYFPDRDWYVVSDKDGVLSLDALDDSNASGTP
jgi:Dolichyl-phosphate-mannose-protein mannosyltransferase